MANELMKDTAKFLDKQIWQLTFAGAFQRANIYSKTIHISECEKNDFRQNLRNFVTDLSCRAYSTRARRVSSCDHCANIIKVQKHVDRSTHSKILQDNHIRIGIVQKVFNLYLKIQWCLGNVQEPPHCPFDSIIIKQLEHFEKVKWTLIDDINEYKKLVYQAEVIMKKQDYRSLAQWELSVYDID